MRWRLLVVALVVGCPAPGIYVVDLPNEPCARATQASYRSMVELGYTVTRAVEPRPGSPGEIEGVRRLPDGSEKSARVRITCDDDGVQLRPVEGALVPSDYEFSRAFGYSVKSLLALPDDVARPREEVGLQVLLEQLDGPRAQVELGGPVLAQAGVLVRATVRNHTGLALVLDAERIALITEAGDPVQPLRGDAVSVAIGTGAAADEVRGRLLTRTRVPAGETVVRYLVFPPWSYVDAHVAIEDPTTGEREGFVVPVQ